MREFTVADIVLSAGVRDARTWVSFPYAAGAPGIMRAAGGRWDKVANAWSVPNASMESLGQKFGKLAELVRVQQSIDGDRRSKPGRVPDLRSAAPLRMPTAQTDWVSIGELANPADRQVVLSLGCAARLREWFAPNIETATRALAAMTAGRLAREDEALRRQEARQLAAFEAEQLQARAAAVRLQLQPVFGDVAILSDRINFMLELATIWPKARWIWVETRQLDRQPGPPTVRVRTPSGAEADISSMLKRRDTHVSRRVDLIEIRAPVFPVGSKFVTLSRQYWNGKHHDDRHTYDSDGEQADA